MSLLGLIDWRVVVWGTVWVTGLAVALAAVSLADYEAARAKARTRAVLGRAGFQAAVWGGLGLFALGQAGLAGATWLGAAWLAAAAGCGGLAWRAWRRRAG
jgi:hypothetical protein